MGRQKATSSNQNSGKASADVPGQASLPDTDPQTFASTLGHITWLASNSAEHKDKPISWLEQTIFPALLLRQFKLYFKDKQPVAAIIYGRLSDEGKAAWEKTGKVPELENWRAGANIVVFECVSPFGDGDALVGEFEATINASQPKSKK